MTPGAAYRATPKAAPAGAHAHGHYRLRYDRLDTKGKMTIRRAGRMHHITVTDLATGEILSTHLIQPNKTYWRNQQREPGRWPGSSK